MDKLRGIMRVWLPLAALAIVLIGTSFVLVQQALRQDANDPQVQLARDGAAIMAIGGSPIYLQPATVNLAQSLAPFIQMYDDAGGVQFSSGILDGKPPVVLLGVLENARAKGENRVTWQPAPGVRIAAVVVRVPGNVGGYVLAGRSLAEVEARIANIQKLAEVTLLLVLVGLLAVVSFCELALAPR
jgi:hypothetical protein